MAEESSRFTTAFKGDCNPAATFSDAPVDQTSWLIFSHLKAHARRLVLEFWSTAKLKSLWRLSYRHSSLDLRDG